jgi:two-component system chemotaxis sensor kinase CheA
VRVEVFETLLDPVFVLDEKSRIIYCNDSAAQACGLSQKKILKTKPLFTEVIQFQDCAIDFKNLPSISEPLPYTEATFARTNETARAQVSVQREFINEIESWIVFFRDVTLEEKLQKKYRSELSQKENVILDLQKAQTELENYSRNLEKMVDERTFEIKQLNSTITAMLDSLNQGFFMFDEQGLCSSVFSKACLELLEKSPSKTLLWDVLNLQPQEEIGMKNWINALFLEMLPFEDIASLGPKNYQHSKGKTIKLDYHPMRSQSKIEKVIVVATDITQLIAAKNQSEMEKAKSKSVLQLIQFKKQAVQFINEAETLFEHLFTQIKSGRLLNKEETFVILHTLKGGAATFSIKEMVDQCHYAETCLNQWSLVPSPVSFKKLASACQSSYDAFVTFLNDSHLILGDHAKRNTHWVEIAVPKVEKFLQQHTTSAVVEKFRHEFFNEPLEYLFSHFNEIVQQIAFQESKKINPLRFEGGDIKVDPQPFQGLIAALVHCYKNAADHGIEPTDLRWERGKPETATITTRFSRSNEELSIEINDDGSGIDPAIIRKTLDKKNLPHQHLNDDEVIQSVFLSEFSTKSETTTASGRGVGLSAVQTEVKKLNGSLKLQSVLGKGLKITIKIPYPIKAAKAA